MTGMVRSPAKPNEAAAYIEQATAELRDLAAKSGMPFLAYLIDMARMEAATRVLTPPRSPAVGVEPRGELR
ncbi:MAG: hypothetical protein LWW93_10225 [Hyphomicrobiales bacterium]|nr:hypothetical protein [Hyphomicrobiales bacterium]